MIYIVSSSSSIISEVRPWSKSSPVVIYTNYSIQFSVIRNDYSNVLPTFRNDNVIYIWKCRFSKYSNGFLSNCYINFNLYDYVLPTRCSIYVFSIKYELEIYDRNTIISFCFYFFIFSYGVKFIPYFSIILFYIGIYYW